MLKRYPLRYRRQHGVSLLEVLVTIVILAFGLLGLAGLQAKIQLVEVESFQRGQAILLLNDMSERISANRTFAANYVSATTVRGTGDSQSATCASETIGLNRDLCQWSNALKGSSEQKSGSNVGTMTGGRGCIRLVQAADPTPGTCTPGIYEVTVAWQGLHKTITPASTCGKESYGSGSDDAYRRAISARVSVGLTGCLPL